MATELLEAPKTRSGREARAADFVTKTMKDLGEHPQVDAHGGDITEAPLIGGRVEMTRSLAADGSRYRASRVLPTE